MRSILIGLLIGTIIALSPIFLYSQGPTIEPVWNVGPGTLCPQNSTETIDPAKSIIISDEKSIRAYSLTGNPLLEIPANDSIFALSGNGSFYARYQKVGEEIEYSTINGEKLWKIQSKEYPVLSESGKLILLFVADQSRIRFLNFNGLETGIKSASGRLCTSTVFSQSSDSTSVSFLEGNIYVIDKNGNLIYSGTCPKGNSVKSSALSPSLNWAVYHYGNGTRDGIMTVDIINKKSEKFLLPTRHLTRTGISINDNGDVVIINNNRILLFSSDGGVIKDIPISGQLPGLAKVLQVRNMYAVSFRSKDGGCKFYLIDYNGEIITQRNFTSEPFLDLLVKGNILAARGIDSLYAWKLPDSK